VGGEGGGSADQVPGGEEEEEEGGGGVEEEADGEGGGEGVVGVGVGAGGEAEDQAAEETDGGGEGEFGQGEEEAVLPVEAGDEEGADCDPVEGEHAGDEGDGFGELEHGTSRGRRWVYFSGSGWRRYARTMQLKKQIPKGEDRKKGEGKGSSNFEGKG
jgi:hypothetical protein